MNSTVRGTVVQASVLAIALSLSVSFTACSSGDEEAALQAERQARLDELAQQQQELQTARQELIQLQERLVQSEAGNLPAGEEVDATELRIQIEQGNARVSTMAEELNVGLAEFINANPPVEGEPVDPLVERAFAMKAEEDIAIAQEYITAGGDYARAIGIYEDILAFDPANAAVQEAKAEAERLRYMTEERLAQVRKDMTLGEVEQALGPANLRNRKEYADQGVLAWYYPKSGAGDAAGVWFRKQGDVWIVFKTDYNAVPARGEKEAAQ